MYRPAVPSLDAMVVDDLGHSSGSATLVFGDAVGVITPERGFRAFTSSTIAGVRETDAALTLHLVDGSSVVVEADQELSGRIVQCVDRAVCELGEVTRSMVNITSRKWQGDADRSDYFAPFLKCVEQARNAGTLAAAMGAFGREVLEGALSSCFRNMAERHHPERQPEQRAIVAVMHEHTAAALSTLERMDAVADEVLHGPQESRYVRWQEWRGELEVLALLLDRGWGEIAVELRRRAG